MGFAISATAEFDLVNYDFGAGSVSALQITLTNTAATTDVRGNLVTGIFFNLSGVGAFDNTSTGFDGLAATVKDSMTTFVNNVDLGPAINGSGTDGTYLMVNGGFGVANDGTDFSGFGYGISTVGQGLGFNGAAVNGDDYGIHAPGSDFTLDGLPSTFPSIELSATFRLKAPAGLTSLTQLDPVARITYGSLPDNFLTTPEPGTGVLVGMGLVGIAWRRRKR